VAHVDVPELFGEGLGPTLEFGGVDLDGGAAMTTREVVVVRVVHATPIEGLAAIGHHHVDLVGVGEFLELAVHRGQGHLTPVAHDESVQILGADEALDPLQGADDLSALAGVSRHGHDNSVVVGHLLTGMVPANVFRMVLKKRPAVVRVATSLLVLAGGSLSLSSCASSLSTPGVINVVAAEVQYGDVVSQIGGAYVHVTSVVNNPNTDPHNFEASPRVAQAIAIAHLIVQNGAGYDAFMNQLEAASPSSSRVVLTVSDFFDHVAVVNPHLWYQPSIMVQVAQGVTSDLAVAAPTHAAYFRARGATFLAQWHRVTVAIASARRHYRGDAVATTEPVADDLLAAMGLVNRTPWRFQADVMNGVDPSPQDIVFQQNLIARRTVRALCFNAQVSSPVTRALRSLATSDHVPVVAVYEIMPRRLHVQTWMLAAIAAIEAALGHDTSTGSIA